MFFSGFLMLAFLVGPPAAFAQSGEPVSFDLLSEVMPSADRFSDRSGDPPVYRAYIDDGPGGGERLIGFAFLTSDLPPEVVGYLAPIRVLVGMNLDGTLSGVRIIHHREPLAHSRRDFMEDPAFLGQFREKYVGERFRLESDVRGISGATVSVEAMARGIRNAARRVGSVYLAPTDPSNSPSLEQVTLTPERLGELSWFDFVSRGGARRLEGAVDGMARIEIFFRLLHDEREAELLLGPRGFEATEELRQDPESRDRLMFLGLDGQNLAWFRPALFFVVQAGDTLSVSQDDLVLLENLRGGLAEGQLGSAGLWVLDERVDSARPFSVLFGGDLGLSIASVEHPGRLGDATARTEAAPAPSPDALTEVDPEADPAQDSLPEDSRSEQPSEGSTPPLPVDRPEDADRSTGPALAPSTPLPMGPDTIDHGGSDWLSLGVEEDESQFARTLARTSWTRVGGLLILLGLVWAAFVSKNSRLRWATLLGTLFFLGFVDRGFLSISHISSAIVVGPGLFMSDLSLLILVGFTVVTTLFWGRVFCGYLCPFGVLQDLLDRFVPRRFKRKVPWAVHDRAILLKYLLLALILVPASFEVVLPRFSSLNVSLYHYIEPFGTVFFLSSSLTLWIIAAAFLAGSVVVPRFYCRYICPLGASLAVVSRLSPFRIRRVEQCKVCKVCEHSCPTGAIRGAEVDFPECVRCSDCEVKLIEKAGTCRHDLSVIRPRLVQLQGPTTHTGSR